jgi:Fur family zinc uptake transcriptional regulator
MNKTQLASCPHDHSKCVNDALSWAENLCARQGLRLTRLRRRVLDLLWKSHMPMGAYDILGVIREQDGRRTAPPTVYRALAFLLESGLAHRIDSLNAFVGCDHPEPKHQCQFLICRECSTAIELEQQSICDAIIKSSGEAGFKVDRQAVEVLGICAGCQGDL